MYFNKTLYDLSLYNYIRHCSFYSKMIKVSTKGIKAEIVIPAKVAGATYSKP